MLTGKSFEFSRFLEGRDASDPYLLCQENDKDWRFNIRHWKSHFRGFVVELFHGKELVLLLNGKLFFCEGKWKNWWPCMDGVAVQKKNEIFYHDEDRKELLYQGNCNRVWSHPEGFIIPLGNNKYLVNGRKKIEREGSGQCNGWSFHPGGGCVERYGRDLINRAGHRFLHNKELLYEGTWESWWALIIGLGIKLGNRFFSVKHNQKKLIFQGEYDEWCSSPYGIITRSNQQFLLHCA